MKLYIVTIPVGPRKRKTVGIFTDEGVAGTISQDYNEASVEEINVHTGSVEEWRNAQTAAAKAAVLAKLTPAEAKLLNLG